MRMNKLVFFTFFTFHFSLKNGWNRLSILTIDKRTPHRVPWQAHVANQRKTGVDSVLHNNSFCHIPEKRLARSVTPFIISRSDDAVHGYGELTDYPTLVSPSASDKSWESSFTIRSHSEQLSWRLLRIPFGSCSQLLGIIPTRGLFHEVKTSTILSVFTISDSLLFTLIPRCTLSRRPSRRHPIFNNHRWHHTLGLSEVSAKEICSRGKGMPFQDGMDSCIDSTCHTCGICRCGSN